MKIKNLSIAVAEYILRLKLSELSQVTRYKIADFFGINKNYLSERFKKESGMYLSHFITMEKMKRAEILLRSRPELTIKTISRMVGCAKTARFTQTFRSIYLLNPSRYRNISPRIATCIRREHPRQCLESCKNVRRVRGDKVRGDGAGK